MGNKIIQMPIALDESGNPTLKTIESLKTQVLSDWKKKPVGTQEDRYVAFQHTFNSVFATSIVLLTYMIESDLKSVDEARTFIDSINHFVDVPVVKALIEFLLDEYLNNRLSFPNKADHDANYVRQLGLEIQDEEEWRDYLREKYFSLDDGYIALLIESIKANLLTKLNELINSSSNGSAQTIEDSSFIQQAHEG